MPDTEKQRPVNDLNETLLDELTQCCEGTAFSDKELARLDALFAALETDGAVPEVPERDVEACLAQLHQRYPALPMEDTAKTKKASSGRVSRRIIVLAAVLVVLIGAVSVQAFGNVFQAVARWTSQVFQLDSQQTAADDAKLGRNDMEPEEERQYDTPQEMLTDLNIRGQLLPAWVPERLGTPVECRAVCQEDLVLSVMYVGDGEAFLSLRYYAFGQEDNRIVIEKDQEPTGVWNYGGIMHYHFTDMDLEKAAWVNGDFQCVIVGTISEEEMERVIASIYSQE